MKTYGLVRAFLACMTVSAFSKADASAFDSANPLHCAAQFEAYSIVARQKGDLDEAGGFGARAQFYAERARALPPEQLTQTALLDLGNRVAAQPDGGAALGTECLKRQDADPQWQRLVYEAKKALAKGRR